MGIETKYVCDRCGAEQGTSDQMWNIKILVSVQQSNSYPKIHVLWCRKCAEEYHLVPNIDHKRAGEELPPEPSIEDKIKDLIGEEVGRWMEDGHL